MEQVADLKMHQGPPMIFSENARRATLIFVDIRNIDVGSYIKKAQAAIADKLKMPPGYSYFWSGQFEYMETARKRLTIIIPITLAIIFFILYINTASITKVCIVLLAVPFSLVGAIWLLYLLGYHISVAVVVGLIALAGLDAETGVVMLLYLDIAYHRAEKEGPAPHLPGHGRRGHGRGGAAPAAQAHDGDGHPGGPGAPHVRHRHRFRSHETHRRPHGGRGDYLVSPGALYLPVDLLAVEVAHRAEAAKPASTV